MDSEMVMNDRRNKAIWIGVAVGTAVGLGIAFSRRKRSPWDSARAVTKRVANRSADISEIAREMVERVRTIYDEGRKVVDDAGELWIHGRKLVGY